MSDLTVKAQVHNSKSKKVRSTIDTDDSEEDDDAEDKADDKDIQFLRQLTEWCESVELLIATNGFRSCEEQTHALIPDLYSNCFDLTDFPYLADYYKNAINWHIAHTGLPRECSRRSL